MRIIRPRPFCPRRCQIDKFSFTAAAARLVQGERPHLRIVSFHALTEESENGHRTRAGFMYICSTIWRLGLASTLLLTPSILPSQDHGTAVLPDVRQLMREVQDHQKQLEKVRETYTYSSL